ncbi:hypothetical protein IU409_23395 [Nocardia cyriacigeorgica]|nr:hypothetical protein [Nocardia cyriacigeorgica]
MVVGRSINGRTDWKTTRGLSYGEWEARGVESTASAGSEESVISPSTDAAHSDGQPSYSV